MKKWLKVSALGLAIGAVSVAAWAASIENLSGQSCGASVGTWHFVNNQVPAGSGTGTLMASWDSGNSCTVTASAVNKSTQHFYCTASGALTAASTNLGGRLVLSHFTCGEPPKCDPKVEKCD